jgi:tellurite resistance protein TerC
LLALDLGVFHRDAREVRAREAVSWTLFWIALALAFNGAIYARFGRVKALEFLTGYVIEKALSVDNLFVFMVIFSTFAVPRPLQHRLLFWGVLGALVLRALFILVGAALLATFHWVAYVFGAFLVATGIKLLLPGGSEVHPEKNPLYRLFRRVLPTVPEMRGGRFVVMEGGRMLATPLLLVLVAVEASDIAFAVDSIPAIFAVTTDPFLVYTSNVFAILGLRSLYFVLARMLGKFRYLEVGLALVLAFVGAKMLLADVYKIPIGLSLLVVALLLLVAIVASMKGQKKGPLTEE